MTVIMVQLHSNNGAAPFMRYIPGTVASTNRFSRCAARCLLLCVSITVDPASAFILACQPNVVLVENEDTC